jgi:D-alanyl-D-alanine carboxypeptidase/D-alanyl-D-alanine-endopeptidase (penicillin-binding protein 4)
LPHVRCKSKYPDRLKKIFYKIKNLQKAHIGISIYDPASQKYLYNYQGDKYFVPASNTKLPTCYAAMKYLGDSLVAYLIKDTADEVIIRPMGDPSFYTPILKANCPSIAYKT